MLVALSHSSVLPVELIMLAQIWRLMPCPAPACTKAPPALSVWVAAACKAQTSVHRGDRRVCPIPYNSLNSVLMLQVLRQCQGLHPIREPFHPCACLACGTSPG